MNDLELFDNRIRVDHDGFICITDMWVASGGSPKNQPRKFLINESTNNYVETLLSVSGIQSVRIVRGGPKKGTWVHKLVAYKYGSWISSIFEIATYTVLDKYFSGDLQSVSIQDQAMHLIQKTIACDNKGSFHGRELAFHKKRKHQLHDELEEFMDKVQIKIDFSP